MVESVLKPPSYLPRVKFKCNCHASDGFWLLPKISCKFFDSLAKLKLSFGIDPSFSVTEPELVFGFKNLSLKSDVRKSETLIVGSFDPGSTLRIRGSHDVKAKKGEVAMVGKLVDSGYNFEVSSDYKFELASAFPSFNWPKAKLKSPLGEVAWDETSAMLSLNGILLKASPLNGVCTYTFEDKSVNLRCSLRHGNTIISPSISLPSKALSFKLNHALSPSKCFSYLYDVNSKDVSVAYKHKYGENYKLKAGYASGERFGWVILRLGDENGKVNFRVEVFQDDIRWGRVLFRVKKRWNCD